MHTAHTAVEADHFQAREIIAGESLVDALLMDETRIQVHHEIGRQDHKDSYMWFYGPLTRALDIQTKRGE
jgi:hypothetical protein